VAFLPEVHDVTIIRDGPRRIIVPAGAVWDAFFDSPGIDLGECEQPQHQECERFCLRSEDWLAEAGLPRIDPRS